MSKKAEELASKLMSGDATTASNTTDEAAKGRKRAARDWVQHFVAVSKFVKELDEKPESIEDLETALIASWEAKADNRNSEFQNIIGGV